MKTNMMKYVRSSEYIELKKSYSNRKEFADSEKQSGELRDLLDRLEGSGVSYDVYNNKTNNGCTVFYDDIKTSVQAATELTPKAARKICTSSWGYDAVNVALNYLSDKLDGYDGYGDSFDVSYQGTASQLTRELASVLESAGLSLKSVRSGKIVYDNSGSEVKISIYKLPEGMDYTFTENSTGYSIDVEERI